MAYFQQQKKKKGKIQIMQNKNKIKMYIVFGLNTLTIRLQVLYCLESRTQFMKVPIYLLLSVGSHFTDLKTILFDLLQIFTGLWQVTFVALQKECFVLKELDSWQKMKGRHTFMGKNPNTNICTKKSAKRILVSESPSAKL